MIVIIGSERSDDSGLAFFLLGGLDRRDHTPFAVETDRLGLWSLWAARSAVQGGVGNARWDDGV